MPRHSDIYSIMAACSKLSYPVVHRRFSNKDYILKSTVYGYLSNYNRERCLYRLKEHTKKEVQRLSEEFSDCEVPKSGTLTEWVEAQENFYLIQQMIDEIRHHDSRYKDESNNPVSVFVGTIGDGL